MGFLIELVKDAPGPRPPRRAGRRTGRRETPVEVLDSLIEDGEIGRLTYRQGFDRLPTLARLDPYADHVFDAYWCALLLTDIARVDTAAVTPAESAVLEKLAEWAHRCVGAPEGDHRLRFSGD
ncbi:hypothetical protein [Streptomyces sp. NPDC014805]|uniref:hypothetical protein n=1 Tax=Streptomyces sp. NPDC014805 TaxID=3364919 RepID=UPI0036FF3AA7